MNHTRARHGNGWTATVAIGVAAIAGCGGSGGADTTGSGGGGGQSPTVDAGLDGSTPDGAAAGDDAGACETTLAPSPGLVVTDRGPVQGTSAGGTWQYLGVPYAAPPVGALRWTPPAPHACWSSPLAASSWGAMCLQVDPKDTTKVLGDEDCLTLNVWTPAGATPTSELPVLFFVHGGGNVQGASSATASDGTYLYEGSALAAQEDAVVVTINYRLGAMGFLAHPAFAAESAHGAAGNYGTLDQLAALRWVQSNAAAFGGDPSHVLLFGESAGAVNVCALVASPLAKGLFTAALMESGGCTARTKAQVTTFAQGFAQKLGCGAAADPATCLRALSASAVTTAVAEPASIVAAKQGDYQPNADGWVLLDNPHATVASGAHNHVPFLIGSNSDETSQEVPATLSEADYEKAVLAYAGGVSTLADQILAKYPASDFGGSPRRAFVAVTSDAKFVCTARWDARAAAQGQTDAPVFRYFYTHAIENGSAAIKALGAWHGGELPFVFRHLHIAGYTPSAGETTLAGAVEDAWTSLAKNGDPSSGALAWPRYDVASDPYVQLDDTIAGGEGVRTSYCDFWDGLLGR